MSLGNSFGAAHDQVPDTPPVKCKPWLLSVIPVQPRRVGGLFVAGVLAAAGIASSVYVHQAPARHGAVYVHQVYVHQ